MPRSRRRLLQGDVTDMQLFDVTPLSLGLETEGGVMTTLIEKNTTIPVAESKIFSTAADNQSAVTVHVLQGERKRASENKSLGNFNLGGIQPAPRGIPQIEVKFDIDANGILHVTAIDRKTNKDAKITITADSGLTEEEIERMVADAKDNEEEDKKFADLSKARNGADTLSSSVRDQLRKVGGKLPDDKQKEIREHCDRLEEAAKGNDLDAIKNATEALSQVLGPLLRGRGQRRRGGQGQGKSRARAGGQSGKRRGRGRGRSRRRSEGRQVAPGARPLRPRVISAGDEQGPVRHPWSRPRRR